METLFIDTHVAVWLYYGKLDSIPVALQTRLGEGEMLLSPISLLEIDYLHEVKKISQGGKAIYSQLNQDLDINLAAHDWTDVITEASHVKWTRDVFDRLIVAHAKYARKTLITKDQKILANFSFARWNS